ncbi:MAG: tRNA preQ1(34) S-adenosylmethionine ribosyltransferase-isomerase QueA [Kiritimatiellae bacterium]|jgi:S-adenosylmethionine:tRNA ribosyltransferase-isomerase|nr:tRNA preQ1(34) S-adenosylmethionine ribosyltransferase-isomerase QueA [Kiritimatiellia bacterium]
MRTKNFNYYLPEELIAQCPPEKREDARMMVLHRSSGKIEHRKFSDLSKYLVPNDLLVVNNTKVVPARIFGEREDTGGKVELLLIEAVSENLWESYYRGKARPGIKVILADGLIKGEIVEKRTEGRVIIKLSYAGDLFDILEEKGVPPVPPYIKREMDDTRVEMDKQRYQTVFAKEKGAVAAPTAGLHFTDEHFQKLFDLGVFKTELTLHVGPGTFAPVKVDKVEDHVMHEERYEITKNASDAICKARNADARVIAVGSTSVRTLETVAQKYGKIQPDEGRSSIFIYPGYEFKAVDAMITNFHLPKSTLIMMVAAFAGKEFTLEAYKKAVEERYRFFSYGDCMLIL